MNNPLSFKLLHLLTKISYWGSLALIAIVTIAGIVILSSDPQLMKLGLPMNMSLEQEVTYLQTDPPISVPILFEASTVRVPAEHLSKGSIISILVSTFVFLGIVAYIAHCFRSFMGKVVKGETFHIYSILALRKAALGLLILEILGLTYELIGGILMPSAFELGNIKTSMSISFPSTPIILALALWVLSHIFTRGKDLEDEQKLTV